MTLFLSSLGVLVSSMPAFVLLLALVWVGKVVYDRRSPLNFDDVLVKQDVGAFGVHLGGLIVGLGIALTGTLYGHDHSLGSYIAVALYGMMSVILLLLSVWVNDKFILRGFSIMKEIVTDRNYGTAFVVAGSSIATGFMLQATLTGESNSFLRGFLDMAYYWVVGQVLLVVGAKVFRLMTSYDDHYEIANQDNAAVGLSYGGFLVAVGLIANAALKGTTSAWVDDTIITAAFALVGFVLLPLTRVVVDWALLPTAKLDDEVGPQKNVACGALSAASFVIVGMLFGAVVHAGSGVQLTEASNVPAAIQSVPQQSPTDLPAQAKVN